MVSQISWKNLSGRHCLCLQIRLQHVILTQYEAARLPRMVLLAYCCITDRCVCAWAVLLHEPAALAGGMWRGSPAWRNDLLHERLVISCWEDRIWRLFNLGKVGMCACLYVCASVQAALHNTLTGPSGSYPYACFNLVIPSDVDYNVEVQNAAVSDWMIRWIH